ncbi:hypothetical protein JXL19_00340 [bacterium]|nr:hypothetical protein [bacterium]
MSIEFAQLLGRRGICLEGMCTSYSLLAKLLWSEHYRLLRRNPKPEGICPFDGLNEVNNLLNK